MKKMSKKTKRPIKGGEPAFTYTSVCHNVRATKEPCAYVGKDSKEAETQGLGKFRCSGCGKTCKVNRSRNVDEQTTMKVGRV